MVTVEELLDLLPPLKAKETVIVDDQDTEDIVNEVLDAHNAFKSDYDRIAGKFMNGSPESICRDLFEFCKKRLPYRAESEKMQTTRSPTGILAMAKTRGVDCKHYAGFIGGVLDAINRRAGEKKNNWDYRFVSYDLFNEDPQHVYVVVKKPGREIWLDPAPVLKGISKIPRQYDDRMVRAWYSYDKKATMALVRINGAEVGFTNVTVARRADIRSVQRCGCANGYGLGTIGFISPDMLAQAIPVIKNFFNSIFGSGSIYSLGVRWLTQQYMYYVLGDASATGSRDSDDAITPDAQAWFSMVLGVPIYDRYRLHALMGTNAADGKPLGKSDAQRAADYLALGPDTANIDPKAVAQAVQIAKQFTWGSAPGSWAKFGTPAPEISKTGTGTGSGSGTGPGGSTDQGGGTGVTDFIQANPVESLGLAALIGFGLYKIANPKPKR